MTTTGYGDIYPVTVGPRLLCSVQQCLSVFFNGVLMSIGIGHFITMTQVHFTKRRTLASTSLAATGLPVPNDSISQPLSPVSSPESPVSPSNEKATEMTSIATS
jgi:hypothetical protein